MRIHLNSTQKQGNHTAGLKFSNPTDSLNSPVLFMVTFVHRIKGDPGKYVIIFRLTHITLECTHGRQTESYTVGPLFRERS